MYTMSVLKRINFIFIVLFVFTTNYVPSGLSLKHRDGKCVKEGCKCYFPNNKVLDLSHNITVPSINIPNQNNQSIIFHPCQDVKFGVNNSDNKCFNGASICLQYFEGNDSKTLILGKATMGVFDSVDSTQDVTVVYTEDDRVTRLYLKCAQDVKDSVTATKTGDKSFELFWTSSSNATCPEMAGDVASGLSTGSVLVILLLMFILLYFGGGMLALKYLRGAEGKEMIPNYDFWVDLPYLVRDGILFTLQGFNTPTTYDRI